MKKQTLYKLSLELLVAILLIISSTYTLNPLNNNFSQDTTSKFLLNKIFHQAQAAETNYQAEIIEQSNYVINILPGKGFTFSIKIKNTGSKSWPASPSQGESRNGSRFFYIKSSHQPSIFRHNFWLDSNTALRSNLQIAPGETTTLKFALQGPPAVGLYSETFALMLNNNTMIPGSMFELPINVTLYPHGKAPKPTRSVTLNSSKSSSNIKKLTSQKATGNIQSPPATNTAQTAPPSTTPSSPLSSPLSPQVAGVATSQNIKVVKQLSILTSEPDIRVGLYWSPAKLIQVTADGEFAVYAGGIKQGHYGAGTIVKVQYLNGVYNLILPSGTASFNQPLVFKPLSESTILELPDYERRVGWNASINDNRFKGNIEIKYNPRTDRLWAINELPLEDYVAGIDETSNIDVPEFHKALAVAARTYALFHLLDNTRYRGFFHVDDNNDQIYRGYNASRRLTHFVTAVEETAGQVVTLNDDIVVTPYFTQSNGQTKSYSEVWGLPSRGDGNGGGLQISHLISVPVPQDVGRNLIGHGVGMSAQGAKRMAELDNLDYQTILKHFYTGVDISKVY